MSLDPEQWILINAGLREDPLIITRAKAVELLRAARAYGAGEERTRVLTEVCEWLSANRMYGEDYAKEIKARFGAKS